MGFWKRSKEEIKRLITFNLHSYWEVFYLDLIIVLLGFSLAVPLTWLLQWFGVAAQITTFMMDNVEKPIESNVVKMIAPCCYEDSTYKLMTAGLIFAVEMILIHLILCEMYRLTKQSRVLEINPSADETCDLKLPLYNDHIKKEAKSEKEEKIPSWKRFGDALIRLCTLNLNSYWEVFYLDALFVLITFSLSIPCGYLSWYFSLQKSMEKITYPVNYVEKTLEKSVVRPMAPSGLQDYSFEITVATMYVGDIILFHVLASLGYYLSYRRNSVQDSSEDVEKSAGCFSRKSRIAPEEKKRPLKKIYESVYSISSLSLFPNGSTEKLIDKAAFP